MSILNRIQAPFIAPGLSPDDTSLPALRERALAANLFILVSLGTLGYLAFLVGDIIRGFQDPSYWREIPVNTVGFLVLLGIAFGRRLPYRVRAGFLTLIFTLVSVSDKLQAGLSGIGELFLMLNVVLMSIFFGVRGGFAALGIAVAALAIPGWLMTSGRIPLPLAERANSSASATAWALTTIALVIISLMIVVSLASVMQGIQGRRR